MLEGETLRSGASATCDECGVQVKLAVCQSAAGYYIGTNCNCGPYTRETGYYETLEECRADLEKVKQGHRISTWR